MLCLMWCRLLLWVMMVLCVRVRLRLVLLGWLVVKGLNSCLCSCVGMFGLLLVICSIVVVLCGL